MAKKTVKKKAGCKCADEVDKKLEASGVKLVQHMRINFTTGRADMSGPVIEIKKVDGKKRGRIPVVPCNYCPFCGVKRAD